MIKKSLSWVIRIDLLFIFLSKETILTSFSGERSLEVGEWFLSTEVLSALNEYGADPGGNEESGDAF